MKHNSSTATLPVFPDPSIASWIKLTALLIQADITACMLKCDTHSTNINQSHQGAQANCGCQSDKNPPEVQK